MENLPNNLNWKLYDDQATAFDLHWWGHILRNNKTENMNKNENLQDWIFHYNIYTGNWEAAKREHYVYLFSGSKPEAIIKSAKIEVLVELINKYDDAFKINKLF